MGREMSPSSWKGVEVVFSGWVVGGRLVKSPH